MINLYNQLAKQWEEKKIYFKLHHLLIDIFAKFLIALGLGSILTNIIKPFAIGFILMGLLILIPLKIWLLNKKG